MKAEEPGRIRSLIPQERLKRNAGVRMRMMDETIYSLGKRWGCSHMTVQRRWGKVVTQTDVNWLSIALHVPTWALLSEDPCDVGCIAVPEGDVWRALAKRYLDLGPPYVPAEEIWNFEEEA